MQWLALSCLTAAHKITTEVEIVSQPVALLRPQPLQANMSRVAHLQVADLVQYDNWAPSGADLLRR